MRFASALGYLREFGLEWIDLGIVEILLPLQLPRPFPILPLAEAGFLVTLEGQERHNSDSTNSRTSFGTENPAAPT